MKEFPKTSAEKSSCCLGCDYSQILQRNSVTDENICLLTFNDFQQMGLILTDKNAIHDIYYKCLEFDNALLTILNDDLKAKGSTSSTHV
ncbi:unnamed protein product [Hymenolepis diminuta]|uniref:Uncharacterized protein n=1 Tax=Hymenolepis diminuta TaxID=6216 RepID=A0A564Y973_HYMDI|nr:unnamed protein product [Hymenolepis diminuta]